MDWVEYLKRKRDGYLSRIPMLEDGRIGTHEMREGQLIDTTADSLQRCRDNLVEIERILAAEADVING